MAATTHTTDVTDSKVGGSVFGGATLIITERNLNIQVRTTGLEPGNVFSVWGKINGGSSFNLTGGVATGGGAGNFTGNVQVDPALVLTKFQVIIKDHGDPEPTLVDDQKTTKTAACPDDFCPEVRFATFDIP